MTNINMKQAALSVVAVTAFACGGAALAASDYYLKLGGVKGETRAKGNKNHKDWIEISSVAMTKEDALASGIRVAVGDVTGDGADGDTEGKISKSSRVVIRIDAAAPSEGTAKEPVTGQATGRRTYEPIMIRKRIDKSTPNAAPTEWVVATEDGAMDAMLLPAVQKIREAAARIPMKGCKVGAKVDAIAIKQKSTGKIGWIKDATVASCSANAEESLSFNFSKIEY